MCQREYVWVSTCQRAEYLTYLLAGWRRFGHMLFRQNCSGLGGCRSLRVDAARFGADRSQRRTRRANEGTVRLRIGNPAVTPEKVALFQRFQADRSQTRGWAPYESGDLAAFAESFAENPFPTQEWCYLLDDVLIGVGYVDELAGGLSAIYFARDPAYRDRSLGTWNVLCLLDRARALGLPHVYLGYHAAGCTSLQYKARFRPNQRLDIDGVWRDGGN
jgi:arginine-tRNA-protein transferase